MTMQLTGLDPAVRERAEWAMQYAASVGIRPVITSTYRGWNEQRRLRDAYIAGESRFPANAPGDSAHNFGWAFDSVLPSDVRNLPGYDEWWQAVRRFVGFEVPTNDTIHSQVPNWRQFR